MNKWVYIRTSTDDQEPENQIKEIETVSGADYVLFQDKQSAWKDNKDREDFEKLKAIIKKTNGGDLYVWDWDRLFRNRKKLKEFFKFCTIYKCKIHSFRQSFYEAFYTIPAPFDEIMQELFLNLLGWMAEDESTKKSQRVRAAVRKKGSKTVSYKGNKWGRPSIHTNKIKRVLELRTRGETIREIAKITKLSIGKVSEICSEKHTLNLSEETPSNTDFNNHSINEHNE